MLPKTAGSCIVKLSRPRYDLPANEKKRRGENMMEEKSQQERINELYRQLSPENRRRAAAFVDSLKAAANNLLPAADSPA